MKNKIGFGTVVFFACIIGLYPIIYLYFYDSNDIGLLESKSTELLESSVWRFFFYTHIIFGGIALLVGWTQFMEKRRRKNLSVHRKIGYVYFVSVLFSGLAGAYLAFNSNTLITKFGFGFLALFWLITLVFALKRIKQRKIDEHYKWVMRNYAITFAAVTLRIWMPFLIMFFKDFVIAYDIVSWLCWVPNVIFIEWLIRKKRTNKALAI